MKQQVSCLVFYQKMAYQKINSGTTSVVLVMYMLSHLNNNIIIRLVLLTHNIDAKTCKTKNRDGFSLGNS